MGVLEMARKSIKERAATLIVFLSFPITRRGLTPRTSASAGVLFYCYNITNRPARSFTASGDTPRHRRGIFLFIEAFGFCLTFCLTFVFFTKDNRKGSKSKTLKNGHFSDSLVHGWTYGNGFDSHHLHQIKPRRLKACGAFLVFVCLTFCLTFQFSEALSRSNVRFITSAAFSSSPSTVCLYVPNVSMLSEWPTSSLIVPSAKCVCELTIDTKVCRSE